MQWNIENRVMIIIKHLEINRILALNKSLEVEQINQTIHLKLNILLDIYTLKYKEHPESNAT